MLVNKSFWALLFALVLVWSCDTEETATTANTLTLQSVLENQEFEIDNVIACAASNEDPTVVSVFLYPREGVTNINYFETVSFDLDKNDYSLYTRGEGDLLPVFNGFLLKYEIQPEQEKWVIVSFEEEGVTHLSNPIRLKHITKSTEYLAENVTVASNSIMPTFTWEDGTFNDSAIYFHAVTTANNDLLSATYTFDRNFQFYNLDNVVLNVTEEEPPNLEVGINYNFTLLAVSEDNWVNLFSEIPFTIQE